MCDAKNQQKSYITENKVAQITGVFEVNATVMFER